MKKYLHYMKFAVGADCILTDRRDESSRGYSLYAEIESPCLPSILGHIQKVYGFRIDGEKVGTSAYNFVDFLRGLLDDESTMKEPFRLTRYIDGRITILSYNSGNENKIFLIRLENENGTFTGLSNSQIEGCCYSIETDHFVEIIAEFKKYDREKTVEDDSILYVDFLPESVISFVRDFIWKNWKEQGFVCET